MIHLEEVPAAHGAGLAAHLRAENAQPGDQLVWASGGSHEVGGSVLWVYDMTSLKSALPHKGFTPEDCEDNSVQASGYSWTVQRGQGQGSGDHGKLQRIRHPYGRGRR